MQSLSGLLVNTNDLMRYIGVCVFYKFVMMSNQIVSEITTKPQFLSYFINLIYHEQNLNIKYTLTLALVHIVQLNHFDKFFLEKLQTSFNLVEHTINTIRDRTTKGAFTQADIDLIESNLYLLQILGESCYDYKDLIVQMGFIELGFDILNDSSKERVDEYGDLDQTMLMTFCKITHNYYSQYEKIRKVLKYIIDEFIQVYNQETGEIPD